MNKSARGILTKSPLVILMGHRNKSSYFFWVGSLFLLVIIEFLVRTKTLSPASYAAPTEIFLRAPKLFLEMNFLEDIGATLGRALVGLALGFPLGITTAVMFYSLEGVQKPGELLLDFIRSIPITTLIPLFIAIYGVGEKNKIVIGGFSAYLVTAITVWIGIKEKREQFETILYLYRPTRTNKILLIVLPHILPEIITALRLATSSALVLVIVAEMFIGTQHGIGKFINDMTYTDDRAAQYAAIVCVGVLGFTLNRFVEWLRYCTLRQLRLNNKAT